ncbi:MAG TPA: RnfABCDGE type electron transport complex subunit D [Candidatus Omnitrophota bacterium]|nr:RnfABCDGE type electron transport complex subunit D [Candidatus Omnitrophota bacterium]
MSDPAVATAPGPFVLAPGPHVRTSESTASIMWTVNAALLPAAAWGALMFGFPALAVIGASILGAVAAEWGAGRMMRARTSVRDGSAVCTGLLLAMTLPPLLPAPAAFLGAVFAILFGKMIFGGLGYNLFNPALIGRAFLMATFPLPMTAGWAPPAKWLSHVDAVTTATPLAALRERGIDAALKLAGGPESPLAGLFLGIRPGSIGEVSVLLLLLGGAVLLLRRIISLTIPLAVVAGVALVTAPTGHVDLHLLSGGLWLGALFMATDYVTSPTTRNGQIVFGLTIGALTGVIRIYGGYPEGICYAILLANALVPALNLWFKPARPVFAGAPS